MICTSCGSHFFKDQYTSKGQCFNYSDVLLDDDINMYADLFIKTVEGKLSDKEYQDIQDSELKLYIKNYLKL